MFKKNSETVAIVGLGYVGLPTAIAASECGFQVVGIDINNIRVTEINKGNSFIAEISNEKLSKLLKEKKLMVTTKFSLLRDSKIILICVPTPLDLNKQPDLSFVKQAIKSIGKYLSENTLVIIESTVSPGTTRDILVPLLSEFSRIPESKLLVAFSPERIDPSNKQWNIKNTPKLVAGITDIAGELAHEFYSKFVDVIIKCKSPEIAETAKLLENTFRLINISFINELAVFCNKAKIDIAEVIAAANTKPYGFMTFHPSLGVGGHCIPVDPIYLSHKAKQFNAPITLIDKAHEINLEMPSYFIERAEYKISGVYGKKILVLGIAYKSNVPDMRESPAIPLIEGLRDRGANVFWHDDLVRKWNGEESTKISSNFDLAILATPHDYFDLTKLGNVPILNTRGSL